MPGVPLNVYWKRSGLKERFECQIQDKYNDPEKNRQADMTLYLKRDMALKKE